MRDAGSKVLSGPSAGSSNRPVPCVGASRFGGLNVRHVAMSGALRWEDVALPCVPALLGCRPQTFCRAAAEWECLITTR